MITFRGFLVLYNLNAHLQANSLEEFIDACLLKGPDNKIFFVQLSISCMRRADFRLQDDPNCERGFESPVSFMRVYASRQ
jgi:hypothetical protein